MPKLFVLSVHWSAAYGFLNWVYLNSRIVMYSNESKINYNENKECIHIHLFHLDDRMQMFGPFFNVGSI